LNGTHQNEAKFEFVEVSNNKDDIKYLWSCEAQGNILLKHLMLQEGPSNSMVDRESNVSKITSWHKLC